MFSAAIGLQRVLGCSILSRFDSRFEVLEIRRAFTCFQLMTILEEAHHSIVIFEHDPMLYEDAAEMVDYVSCALVEDAKDAAVLLYAPGLPPLEELAKNADRVWDFDDEPRASQCSSSRSTPKAGWEARPSWNHFCEEGTEVGPSRAD